LHADLRVGERRVFITRGKGGHQRLIPISARFFTSVAAYLDTERPAGLDTDAVFLLLKGARRGHAPSAAGLDEILDGARHRAGLTHATCHELRHTCLTRVRRRRRPPRRPDRRPARRPTHHHAHDRARKNLDRHLNDILAAYMASGT
jgi:integrase